MAVFTTKKNGDEGPVNHEFTIWNPNIHDFSGFNTIHLESFLDDRNDRGWLRIILGY